MNLVFDYCDLEVGQNAVAEQLESLISTVPGVVYRLLRTSGGEWKFIYISQGIEELYEITAAHAYRDSNVLTNCILADDRESHRDTVVHSSSTNSIWEHEHRIKTPSGITKWVRSQARPRPQPDGSVIWDGLLTDITELKQAKEAQRRSEDRWKFTLEGSGDGVWDWNYQTGEALFSGRYTEMLGFAEGEFGTNASEWASRIHPDDRTAVFDALQAHIDRKTPSTAVEFRMLCKDGSWKWILGRGMVVSRGGDGKPLRIVGTNTDITERKQAEELQRRLMLELKEKERAKTRFLAAAGHDLRQPITAAILFVDTLKLTTPTPHQSELIEKIDESMKAFSDLLEQLLDISKFDAGLIKPQVKSFSLEEIFTWLNHNFSQSSQDKNLSLRFYISLRSPLIVLSDIGLLKSVLMNLVNNAIKCTAHGGVLVSARIHGGNVKLQVWDTGIGIADENISKIFNEFYQVSNKQRSRDGGLGLGLSICKRILSLLGSEISCHSRLGRGSVFTFSIPLDEKLSNAGRLPDSRTQPDVGSELWVRGKKFVVLEDDELVANGLFVLLRESGAIVRLFNNAEEALKQGDICKTDYFIVDYALAGELNGKDFLVALQQKQDRPIHAVVITGETSLKFMKGVADCPWPVMHKPVSVYQLIPRLVEQRSRKT